MPVNENESTAKSASMGVGVDAISNPTSGVQFPEMVVFSASALFAQNITVTGTSGGPTGVIITDTSLAIRGTSGLTQGVSGSLGSGFVGFTLLNANMVVQGQSGGSAGIIFSGLTIAPTSGLIFADGHSGAATGGSGGTFSGKDPVCWARVMVCGTGFRVPLFT